MSLMRDGELVSVFMMGHLTKGKHITHKLDEVEEKKVGRTFEWGDALKPMTN